MSFVEALVTPILTGLTIASLTYIISKKMVSDAKKDIKVEGEAWLNSEKGQKALYSIGVLIGNGARAGIGLNVGKGKFKLEEVLGRAIGNFIEAKIPNLLGQQQQIEQASTFKSEY